MIRLVSKAPKTAVYVHWKMSEPVDMASMKGGLLVTGGGAALAGSFAVAGVREYMFTFAQPTPLNQPIVFSLSPAVKGLSGVSLNPDGWDSGTSVMGTFTVPLTNQPPCPKDGGCWEWQPKLDF